MSQPVLKLDEKSQLIGDRGRQAWKSLKSDETWIRTVDLLKSCNVFQWYQWPVCTASRWRPIGAHRG